MARPRSVTPPDVRKSLIAFERSFRRRSEALEAELEQLRAKRDEAIREAYAGGMPMKEIGDVFGLSHQRVYQIVSEG